VDHYRTVVRRASAELEVKRSVFHCTIAPITDEQQARTVVAEVRSRFPDARHHCSAFVWTPSGAMSRSSDDGEPSGTAGAPMLEVLRGAGLTEVVAVVTRWFGGTLLGAGGLVRAYSEAVQLGLAAAGTRQRQLVEVHELLLDHALAARAESELRGRGFGVLDVEYGQQALLRLGVPGARVAELEGMVAGLTHGRARPVRTGQRWMDC